jgi:hypothetical protein
MGEEPTFDIPARPRRRFSRQTVEYEGETVFELHPSPGMDTDRLTGLVERVLEDEPYRYGDWFELPMPLFLVHDRETGDTFRVAVRDGRVEFHVLPETESAGLHALYERLRAASGREWRVDCRHDPAS